VTLLAPPPLEPPTVVLKAPPMPAVVAEVAPPKPVVQTGLFAAAEPVMAKAAPIAMVRTGGFANASTSPAQADRLTQVTSAGFGDAGIAAAAGARRAVSTGSGFGDAGAAAPAGGSRRLVASSGFGDAVAAAPASAGSRPMAQTQQTAAQILEKPRPAYTEEARRLQIEGEVQLEVMFRASGEVDILRVVRGLGHGLDENAAQAARTIRFLPAKREGRAVDSTATVHIIFQLAS
jgi:TonB family protein